jgi:glutathione S-transferase
MKLFYAAKTCSLAPIILAEWLDIELSLEPVNHRQPSAAYLRINPLGAVPALQLDDGRIFTQVDAILQYFCSLRPDSGLDGETDSLERFELHRWVAFLTGDFHPPFGGWFNPARFTVDHSESSLKAVKQGFEQRIRQVTDVLEAQLGGGEHIALGRRTLLDAYAFAMVRWLRLLPGGTAPWPGLEKFLEAMESDAGVHSALLKENDPSA